MHPLEWFAREDAYSDARSDYLFSEIEQGRNRRIRLGWSNFTPESEEKYLNSYDKYYVQAVKLEVDNAKKIIKAYEKMLEEEKEPPKPVNCENCGTTYKKCTSDIFGAKGKACCSTCAYTATHKQNAWEAWMEG